MSEIEFELTKCNNQLKHHKNEIDVLKENQKKLEQGLKRISNILIIQKEEFSSLMSKNDKLQKKISKKIEKKELSCMQEAEFTDENIAKVREMAICMTKEQIARRFNMSLQTYINREEKLPELKKAFEIGQGTFMAEVSNILVQNIRSGCKASLFYYLNNRMKMKKEDESTNITITQEFLNKPLKIVNEKYSNELDYENEIANKFHNNIMSITVSKNSQNENGE
jgi:DNA-binding XRE family transcriptional regulator